MKVVFNETKFIVNEEKKTVTCIISAKLTPYSQQNEVEVVWGSRLTRNFKVIGVSKCHPEDEFSIEMGKRIAESRAKKKVFAKGRELAKKISNYINILQYDVNKLEEDMNKYHSKEMEHIEELISKTDKKG